MTDTAQNPVQPARVLPPRPVQPPAGLPKNALTGPTAKHPCRCAILGLTHIVDQLQQLIAAREDISPEIRAVLKAEIAAKTSNAAKVDLHVVDHANGDSSIHIHVAQVKLG
jgi:hypothetical protein